jgi:hypothetical protein
VITGLPLGRRLPAVDGLMVGAAARLAAAVAVGVGFEVPPEQAATATARTMANETSATILLGRDRAVRSMAFDSFVLGFICHDTAERRRRTGARG